ncbi:MAG TPA: serine/threonine-protein kinase, partial [Acidimicrobiales bacterium]|nr:serine/threonine-protein kinase [Acidimicrobiales bacterium]
MQQAALDPRRTFGRFTVLAELGRGGMGVVYKAWDRSLARFVALKLLPADADASAVGRFRREALAVARVRHSAIVAVHDAGVANGRPYLAMDYIDGKPLDKRLKSEPRLSLARGVEIVRDVARALQHAHEQGIVHRDLKPQNVMVDAKDRPYVLDFGLAVIRGSSSGLTRTGSVLGTPSYMPPEQVDTGGEVDARTDVYALGATLYHVIAGRPPFLGNSDVNVITAVLTKDPEPASRFNRRAEGDLDTITAKCLEKVPERRYGSAADLAAELDRYLAGEPIVARPIGLAARAARKIRRNPGSSAAVSFALVAALAALGWPRLRAELEARRHAASLARARDAAQGRAARLAASVRAKLDSSE